MTPKKRDQHAAEWRQWRKKNPAGARRAWAQLRDWKNTRHLEMRADVLAEILSIKS